MLSYVFAFDLFQVSVPIMVAIKGKNTRCVTLLLEKLGGHVSVNASEPLPGRLNDCSFCIYIWTSVIP